MTISDLGVKAILTRDADAVASNLASSPNEEERTGLPNVSAFPRSSAGKSPQLFFPNLDGLRFVACALVVLQHGWSRVADHFVDQLGIFSGSVGRLFHAGDLGVSFFFVLSGFLITFLILMEIGKSGKLDVIAFYFRRFLRIWPLYYLVVMFALVVYPRMKEMVGYSDYVQVGNPLYYWFFLGNFDVIELGHGRGAMSTNITWSVAIEEQFYLIWPLLFYFTPRRFYALIFVGVIIISSVFRGNHADDSMVLYFHSISVVSDMALGGLGAYLALNNQAFLGLMRDLRPTTICLGYVFGIALLLFGELLFAGGSWWLAALSRLVYAVFFVFVVLEQNYANRSLFKMCRFATASAIGKYTYGLYLLHPIAIQACIVAPRFMRMSPGIAVDWWVAVGSSVLSLVMAYTSYRWFERPFLNLKRSFSRV